MHKLKHLLAFFIEVFICFMLCFCVCVCYFFFQLKVSNCEVQPFEHVRDELARDLTTITEVVFLVCCSLS